MSDLKVNAGELARAMKHVAQVVEKRSTIPILANVLFEAGQNCLSIVATDLDLQIKQDLPAASDGGFAVTIPAQRLTAIANAVSPDAQLTFTLQDGGRVAIKSGRSRWVLATRPRDDFPRIPMPKGEAELKLQPSSLAEMVSRVSPFRSTDQTRYYLNGPLWHGEDGRVALAATDGHRLMRASTATSATTRRLTTARGGWISARPIAGLCSTRSTARRRATPARLM